MHGFRTKRVRVNPIVVAAILQYRQLVGSNAPEEAIRTFLASHLYFWNGLLRWGNTLYTKVALGADHEIDFVFCDPGSSGAEWHLVEIESPRHRLFTAAGDESKELRHAMRQVRDWQRWIERHQSYARRFMPGVDNPLGHVFMGRRAELRTAADRERLRALNIHNRAHVEIHTFDRFEQMARSTLTGTLDYYQPRALGDKELRAGIPAELRNYIRSSMGRSEDFIEDRKEQDYFDEDISYDLDPLPKVVTRSVPVRSARQAKRPPKRR